MKHYLEVNWHKVPANLLIQSRCGNTTRNIDTVRVLLNGLKLNNKNIGKQTLINVK